MLIEINRFMTAEEVQRQYHIPDELFRKVHPLLPVVSKTDIGQPLHLESQIDQFFRRYFDNSERKVPAVTTRLGRDDDDVDQMIPPDRLRLAGKECEDISGLEYRLCEALLETSSRSLPIDAALEKTYGHDHDDKDNPLRQS